MQVWPIEVNLKFLEPVGRELKQLGKVNFHVSYLFSPFGVNILDSVMRADSFRPKGKKEINKVQMPLRNGVVPNLNC